MTTSQHDGADRVRTQLGREAVQSIIADPGGTLIALDFDGTIAPIIADPEYAHADPQAVAALARLGDQVGAIVVITGRPARTAVRLGGFQQYAGLDRMIVLGQYGTERWDAQTDEVGAEPEPEAIADAAAELPEILGELGLEDVRVEHKGRAIGVHTREQNDPAAAYASLLPKLSTLVNRHGLRLEPGKFVLEIRAAGSDKGDALRGVAAETGARQVVFIGDDLGDLPAFDAVAELRAQGLPGLLVCSASTEEHALTEQADVVASGPGGVANLLGALADELGQRG